MRIRPVDTGKGGCCVKKKILNIVFLLLVFGLTLFSVFHGEDLTKVLHYLGSADLRFIIPSVLCVLLFILGEAVVLHHLVHKLGVRIRFRRCCLYSFIGFFYSCITPSASGGQPMQIIAMRKDGIPVAVSTVVLAIVTIVYKLILVLIGAAVLLLRPASVMIYLEPVESLMYLGLFLNVVCIAILLLLVFCPGLVRILTHKTLNLFNRIHPLRNYETYNARLERLLAQYEGAADFYRKHFRTIVTVFAITLLQRFVLMLITWFTYRAFTLSGHSLPLITALQAMIFVATDMLPVPGGMGISENLFLHIFDPIFGEAYVLPGMMISRGISFYTQLVLCGIVTLASTIIPKFKKKAEDSL